MRDTQPLASFTKHGNGPIVSSPAGLLDMLFSAAAHRRALRLSLLLTLTSLSAFAGADIIEGTAVEVVDGDTIHVLDADGTHHKVRLAYVEAPELEQRFGAKARWHLWSLVGDKPVEVRGYTRKRDGYLVGTVLRVGWDVGLEQLRAGYAWHAAQDATKQNPVIRDRYAEAEAQARVSRLGLWRDKEPTPPWEGREDK